MSQHLYGIFLAVMVDKFALKVIIFLQAVVIVCFKKCVFPKKKKMERSH